MSADETEELATRLLTMLNGGKCIAWIGSGLSAPAKYPGWEEIVDTLCKACEIRKPAAKKPLKSAQLIALAEQCKVANLEEYELTLAQGFGKTVVSERRAYHLLAQLPFKAYITTNYDPLLRDAVRAQTHRFCQYPILHVPAIERQESAAFYIHGLARDGNDQPCGKDLVLAESEFRKAYEDGMVVATFVQATLTSYDLFFIGCSLEEPAIQDCLARIRRVHEQIVAASPEAPIPQRAMLLSHTRKIERKDGMSRQLYDKNAELREDARYRELGIEIVRYETTGDDDHVEIEKVLSRALRMSGALESTGPVLTM